MSSFFKKQTVNSFHYKVQYCNAVRIRTVMCLFSFTLDWFLSVSALTPAVTLSPQQGQLVQYRLMSTRILRTISFPFLLPLSLYNLSFCDLTVVHTGLFQSSSVLFICPFLSSLFSSQTCCYLSPGYIIYIYIYTHTQYVCVCVNGSLLCCAYLPLRLWSKIFSHRRLEDSRCSQKGHRRLQWPGI